METLNHLIDRLLGLPFAVGIIFFLTGTLVWVFPPKKINALYGYRTRNSMASQERWDFSQRYSAKLMILSGFFLVLCSSLKLVFTMSINQQLILSGLLILAAIAAMVLLTEKAIQNKFPQS